MIHGLDRKQVRARRRLTFHAFAGLIEEGPSFLDRHDGSERAQAGSSNAHSLAIEREKRAAGISRIDGDVARDGFFFYFADDAGRQNFLPAERIADCENTLAD